MNHRFNRNSSHGLFSKRRHPSPVSPRWKNLGSCEIAGSVCEWTIHLAIRPEVAGLWSIRWRGEEQDEEVIGPDHLDSLAEELVEDRGIDRDDLLNLFAFSGVEAIEEFARQNRVA
jgi:hypothetical protein